MKSIATRLVSGSVSVLGSDEQLLCDTSGGNCVLGLPAGSDGQELHIADAAYNSGHNIVINTYSGDLFVDGTAQANVYSGGYLQIVFKSGVWYFKG